VADAPAPDSAELDAVVALELALLDPAVRADPGRVAALLHPEFVEVGASGRRWQRDPIVERLAGEAPQPLRAADVAATRLGLDAVLVTYRVDRAGRASWRSSVWVRVGGEWVMRYHQGTLVDADPVPGGGQRP
jgi:hypothetical protein